MANKNLGHATAYGYAKANGYTGTEAEFGQLMASLGIDISNLENMTVETSSGTTPSGSYDSTTGTLTLVLPKGDKGDKGDTGDTGPQGVQGVKGDTGNGIESVELTSTSGSVKTYTITFTDGNTTTFDVTDGEVTDETLAEILEEYAKVDGYYEEMSVGDAEQLIPSGGTQDAGVYSLRTTGGAIDVGDRKEESLVGGTVCWNQGAKELLASNWTNESGVSSEYADGVVTISTTANNNGIRYGKSYIKDHKYLISYVSKVLTPLTVIVGSYSTIGVRIEYNNTGSGLWETRSSINNANNGGADALMVYGVGVYTNLQIKNIQHFDLTAMFGSTIADWLYTLEQTTPGAGVAWFKRYFPKDYYPYDAGSLLSVKTPKHITTGFNQWDEEWELGSISDDTGMNSINGDIAYWRSVNYIPVLPNMQYCHFTDGYNGTFRHFFYDANKNFISYTAPTVTDSKKVFTTPQNAYYMRFRYYTQLTNYKNCINLHWDGERDGEYEAYKKHEYALDSDLELRGVVSLDSQNNLTYDGDTYKSDGTVVRKYGIVDLGTLEWIYNTTYQFFGLTLADYSRRDGAYVCDKYTNGGARQTEQMGDAVNGTLYNWGNAIKIKDTSYSDAATFKTAMSGVYLVYELAEPTIESADPYTNPMIIDDWGTEEFVDERTVAMPVGHDTVYTPDLRSKLEMAPNYPENDGDYLMHHENGLNSYVPYGPDPNKADIDGYYENLGAGIADQLASDIYEEDSEPYLFRTSGGSIEIGDREYDEIVGGTVCWNQLAPKPYSNYTKHRCSLTLNNNVYKLSFDNSSTKSMLMMTYNDSKPTNNHVLLAQFADLDASHLTSGTAYISFVNPSHNTHDVTPNNSYAMIKRFDMDVVGVGVYCSGISDDDYITFKDIQFFDLTQMFGSTIADYIYSLEQSTAGAGVAWFKKLFPKDYYEYNAGELLSVSDLQSHKMVGFNAWDEEWENGWIDANGTNRDGASQIRSKNYIPVIPNSSYYFNVPDTANITYFDSNKNALGQTDKNGVGDVAPGTSDTQIRVIPDNCHYIRFWVYRTTTYNHDICINLAWDNSRNGEYEPYVTHEYPLDDSLTLRGIPKLDANNKLYYDGDIYSADGTVTRRYGIVTLDGSSDEDWSLSGTTTNNQYYIRIDDLSNDYLTDYKAPILANNLETISGGAGYASNTIKGISYWKETNPGAANQLRISLPIDTVNRDLSAFKTWLSNNPVTVVYPLAEPTTEEAQPYHTPQIVDDFGTEEYVSTSIVPVGHNTKYMANLKAKLEMAPNSPNADGDYALRRANGKNTYVPLVLPLDELPALPSENGNYVLKVTVSGSTKTMSWEVES